jgi:pilus assembly protein TadC
MGAAAAGGLCLAASSLAGGPGSLVWLGWPVATLVAAVLLGHLEPISARLRREQRISETPQALDLMATCLAAGMPVRLAGRVVADAFDSALGKDLGRVLALVDLGMSDADAWRTLQDHPQLGPAAQDLCRSVESGTMMVEALRRHAAEAREARRSDLVIRARSVGVRSVLPLMVCFIPAFLLLGVVPTVVSALVAALG